ncbi:conjugal transfer protein TrbF [Paremcibacter congregatus]|uniref:Conjugal transfer protein TrbF n=1 Tax=Paremcibacter congregatus TaxID=2043170 RepID=A0A2G4YNW3_9PROT|nr:conjugal transfer protein TrbF [Paremcibacter congregatus]PHZ84011.1 conjugal transfer protein TrbF [Paremcibacter congregatus]QDE26288.1 conjugal transfer protein TrbF [Paremcibacter congregatus]
MKIFKRQRQSYGDAGTVETPFQKASKLWDRRMGSALMQARNWRLMAFLCLGLTTALVFALITLSSSSRITPYVVEIGSKGEVRAIGSALEKYSPSDAVISYHLSDFISKVRSLPSDPVILRENWLKSYAMVTDQGANILNQYARENDPFKLLGRQTITVDVTSIVRASKDSFQIKWQEAHYQKGSLTEKQNHTAILSLMFEPPRDVASLRNNPLGLYIHDLNWSRDFNPNTSNTKGTLK